MDGVRRGTKLPLSHVWLHGWPKMNRGSSLESGVRVYSSGANVDLECCFLQHVDEVLDRDLDHLKIMIHGADQTEQLKPRN